MPQMRGELFRAAQSLPELRDAPCHTVRQDAGPDTEYGERDRRIRARRDQYQMADDFRDADPDGECSPDGGAASHADPDADPDG